MGTVIWIWKFPNSGKRIDAKRANQVIVDIDQGLYWENVVLLPPKWDDNTIFQEEWLDFRDKIMAVVETIISLGVQDYISIKRRSVSDRQLFMEVESMHGQMFEEALVIRETLQYVEDSYWETFDEIFQLEALSEILHRYRRKVIAVLVRNEKMKESWE